MNPLLGSTATRTDPMTPDRIIEQAPTEWNEDYLANCCHILPAPTGSASAATPAPPALCGRRPSNSPHNCPDPLALRCGVCGRVRCPECANRYRGPR